MTNLKQNLLRLTLAAICANAAVVYADQTADQKANQRANRTADWRADLTTGQTPDEAADETDALARDNTGVNVRDDRNNSDVNVRDGRARLKTPEDQATDARSIDRTQRIREAIVANDGMSTYAQNVKIVTGADGVVTLRGPVRSEAERASIVSIAEGIAGAKNVVNLLEIAPM